MGKQGVKKTSFDKLLPTLSVCLLEIRLPIVLETRGTRASHTHIHEGIKEQGPGSKTSRSCSSSQGEKRSKKEDWLAEGEENEKCLSGCAISWLYPAFFHDL